MRLNASMLAKEMTGAFVGALKAKVPDIKGYAESESKKLAQTLVMIAKLRAQGRIDKEEAKLHLDIQKNASRTVLLTIEGLGALAVEQGINAALDTVKTAVNRAIGFALL